MTRTPVPMNKDFENMQSLNKLVIEIREPFTDRQGNVVPAGKYYVYDDTVTVPGE